MTEVNNYVGGKTNSRNLCIFCCKPADDANANSAETNEIVSKFMIFLGRYIGQEIKLPPAAYHQFNCCEDCVEITNSFCIAYRELECLQLKLNWKLETVAAIMRSSHRNVPSMVQQSWDCLFKVHCRLGKGGQNGEKESVVHDEHEKTLNKFRSRLIQQCSQKLSKSQPRVLVDKMKTDCLSAPVPQLSGEIDNTISISGPANKSVQIFFGWIMSFAAVAVLALKTEYKETSSKNRKSSHSLKRSPKSRKKKRSMKKKTGASHKQTDLDTKKNCESGRKGDDITAPVRTDFDEVSIPEGQRDTNDVLITKVEVMTKSLENVTSPDYFEQFEPLTQEEDSTDPIGFSSRDISDKTDGNPEIEVSMVSVRKQEMVESWNDSSISEDEDCFENMSVHQDDSNDPLAVPDSMVEIPEPQGEPSFVLPLMGGVQTLEAEPPAIMTNFRGPEHHFARYKYRCGVCNFPCRTYTSLLMHQRSKTHQSLISVFHGKRKIFQVKQEAASLCVQPEPEDYVVSCEESADVEKSNCISEEIGFLLPNDEVVVDLQQVNTAAKKRKTSSKGEPLCDAIYVNGTKRWFCRNKKGCTYSSKSKGNMQRHQEVGRKGCPRLSEEETLAPNLTCPECGKAFKQSNAMRSHLKNIHILKRKEKNESKVAQQKRNQHLDAPRHHCGICNISCKTKQSFSRHHRSERHKSMTRDFQKKRQESHLNQNKLDVVIQNVSIENSSEDETMRHKVSSSEDTDKMELVYSQSVPIRQTFEGERESIASKFRAIALAKMERPLSQGKEYNLRDDRKVSHPLNDAGDDEANQVQTSPPFSPAPSDDGRSPLSESDEEVNFKGKGKKVGVLTRKKNSPVKQKYKKVKKTKSKCSGVKKSVQTWTYHVAVVNGRKRWFCKDKPGCTYSSKTKGAMVAHQAGIRCCPKLSGKDKILRLLTCPVCGKVFKYRSSMKAHAKTIHKLESMSNQHSRQKIYAHRTGSLSARYHCSACNTSCKSYSSFLVHQRTRKHQVRKNDRHSKFQQSGQGLKKKETRINKTCGKRNKGHDLEFHGD